MHEASPEVVTLLGYSCDLEGRACAPVSLGCVRRAGPWYLFMTALAGVRSGSRRGRHHGYDQSSGAEGAMPWWPSARAAPG